MVCSNPAITNKFMKIRSYDWNPKAPPPEFQRLAVKDSLIVSRKSYRTSWAGWRGSISQCTYQHKWMRLMEDPSLVEPQSLLISYWNPSSTCSKESRNPLHPTDHLEAVWHLEYTHGSPMGLHCGSKMISHLSHIHPVQPQSNKNSKNYHHLTIIT